MSTKYVVLLKNYAILHLDKSNIYFNCVLYINSSILIVSEQSFGKIWLFFGCRHKGLDLYRDEKNKMRNKGVLDKEFLALSREPGVKKVSI